MAGVAYMYKLIPNVKSIWRSRYFVVSDEKIIPIPNAKTAISEKVDGSSYEGYGGASYPATQVAAN